ncbi:MAG: hypothetical protein ACYDCC_12605 [Actinomycetota bacterium]
MTFEILDSATGNTLAVFEDEGALRAALKERLDAHPEDGQVLLVTQFNEKGFPVGESRFADDLVLQS